MNFQEMKTNLHQEREKLKQMTFRKKLSYIFDYYRWPIFLSVCLIILIALLGDIFYQGTKENVILGFATNDDWRLFDTETVKNQFSQYLGIDDSRERIVFDASLSLADIKNLKEYNVFADGFSKNTRIVCDCFADLDRQRSLEKQGISVMRISAPKSNPSEFWRELKERMFAERITGIYAEGGARVIASICAGKAADFAFEYRSKDLVLGESALGAFDFVPGRGRPFEIKGKTVDFGDDFLEFGSVFYK